MNCKSCNHDHSFLYKPWCDRSDTELEVERLTKIIEEFQKKEYIILKHDNNYYKCYKLEEK